MHVTALITTAVLLAAVSPAAAQTATPSADPKDARSIAACPSQQALEQMLGSGGKFVPDSCRHLTVTPVRTSGQRLCVLNFKSGRDPGLLDRLADATIPTEWWVACSDLEIR
ncbi:hypothetical protein PQJ75_03235 [Rhodoplanes sp. TEM]|uniref:Secreted protein n=1 Tax=Rhodoplanes tepidamans TaxID=200616 RepID=A0ABT5JHP3_RHOTP|nr:MULTISPECIES: hypothetical protein [Rhodoplanes]MDC7789116.1 hypothetical protein [Rhodoplanes tepidamans]MDC7982733.1 hypothetical protein [Rhodoplanes sp. TEM]MDQ0357438.1 hypothetical protein [Rhodoplanes tepidamans]